MLVGQRRRASREDVEDEKIGTGQGGPGEGGARKAEKEVLKLQPVISWKYPWEKIPQ